MAAILKSFRRIVAQAVVVVQIFVSDRQGSAALAQQLLYAVFDQIWIAFVAEATSQCPDRSGA